MGSEMCIRDRSLDNRLSAGQWHDLHGPPQVPRLVLDDTSAILRALHTVLPLGRVETPTNTSRKVENFVRRYGVVLARHIKDKYPAAYPVASLEAGLHQSPVVVDALHNWLGTMSAPKTGQHNLFGWSGFFLESHREGRDLCETAVSLAFTVKDALPMELVIKV